MAEMIEFRVLDTKFNRVLREKQLRSRGSGGKIWTPQLYVDYWNRCCSDSPSRWVVIEGDSYTPELDLPLDEIVDTACKRIKL